MCDPKMHQHMTGCTCTKDFEVFCKYISLLKNVKQPVEYP